MIDDLSDVLAATADDLGLVVHVGAGTGREFRRYTELGAERIVLVEPNTDLHEQLRQRSQSHPAVTISAMAVAPVASRAELKVTSNFRFSSIATPSGLLRYFPNVRVISRQQVHAVSLETLLSDVEFPDGSRNLLVLENQGLEAATLAATPARVLGHFDRILVRRSDEALYELPAQSQAVEPLIALQDSGFSRVTLSESAPPFVIDVYQRNDQVVCLAEQLADAEEQLLRATDNLWAARVLKTDQATRVAELTQAIREHQAEGIRANANLERQKQELSSLAQQLTTLDERLNARDQALAKATHRLRQTESDLKASQNARTGVETALEQDQARLAALTNTLGSEREEAHALTQRLETAEAGNGELEARLRSSLEEIGVLQDRLQHQAAKLADHEQLKATLAESEDREDQQQVRLAELESQLHSQAQILADNDQLKLSLAERSGRVDEQRARIEDLEGQLRAQQQNVADAQELMRSLAERDELVTQERERVAELEECLRVQAEAIADNRQLKQSLQERGERIAQQRARLAELEEQLRVQADALADTRALESALAERDEQTAQAVAQLEAFKNEHAESRQKHRLIEEEVRKAEIQIDLLADVLLRDRSV